MTTTTDSSNTYSTDRYGRYVTKSAGQKGDGVSYSGPDAVVVLEDNRPFGVRRISRKSDCWLRDLNNGATMLDGTEFDFDRIVLKYTFNWFKHMNTWTDI